MPGIEETSYMTPKQLGARYAVNPLTIKREARRGRLKGILVGKQWRFPLWAVEQYENWKYGNSKNRKK